MSRKKIDIIISLLRMKSVEFLKRQNILSNTFVSTNLWVNFMTVGTYRFLTNILI